MSFLGWPSEDTQRSQRFRRQRKRIALELIRRFQRVFPEIAYYLLWESPTINAQAWLFAERRRVTVCGGLVRHPAMTASGIALMLAHETGHRLGGPPRDPDLSWIVWQGQADYWAADSSQCRAFSVCKPDE